MATPDPYWQHNLREQLRIDSNDLTVPGCALVTAMRDYLDRFGELGGLIDDVEEDVDGQSAEWAREILHRHLLVVTLLLEKVNALEAHGREAAWLADHPDHPGKPLAATG